ncbi:MAG: tRNA 2-thiouridine(34) synthase MnmA [Desulfovibrionaceae bacterium]
MNVLVAYSGGTDSTYTLLHYKKKGYSVFAVNAQFVSPYDSSAEHVRKMREFCEDHSIHFTYLDCTAVFQEKVIKPFKDMYYQAKTPNPCVLCNPQMKFGILHQYAVENDFDIFATGHYTQCIKKDGRNYLFPAVDKKKDQSYFLSLVPQEKFDIVEFPMGSKLKDDARKELAEMGVEPPFPSESQEICFVPKDDYRSFLLQSAQFQESSVGEICLFGTKEVIGQHQGLWRYTEGQRKGLSIPWKEPLYVIAKDPDSNILYVGIKDDLSCTSCVAENINIHGDKAEWEGEFFVRTRYRQEAVLAYVVCTESSLSVRFKKPQEPIAKGQLLAVYDKDKVIIAGGILV